MKNIFWTPRKITFVIFILFVFVLGLIAFYIYIGAVEAAGGTSK